MDARERQVQVNFRVSAGEKRALRMLAAHEGCSTSEAIRRLAMREAARLGLVAAASQTTAASQGMATGQGEAR